MDPDAQPAAQAVGHAPQLRTINRPHEQRSTRGKICAFLWVWMSWGLQYKLPRVMPTLILCRYDPPPPPLHPDHKYTQSRSLVRGDQVCLKCEMTT